MSISQRIKSARDALGLTQIQFADRIGFSRNYISRLETGRNSNPLKRFLKELSLLEEEARVRKVAEAPAHYSSSKKAAHPHENVAPGLIELRRVRVYSMVQAGMATDFEMLPGEWEDEVAYLGDDPRAYGLRIVGDSMEPKYSPGDIVIVSPRNPARNGDRVVAHIRDQGVLFKLMHHSGDLRTVTLSSYNPAYRDITVPREDLLWMHPVKQVIKM
jgi:phage repressor protein C with HTH and peptisase S24 domain